MRSEVKGCLVCEHPERAAVEAWLDAGFGPRSISKRINLSRVQIRRHAERCMSVQEEKDEGGDRSAGQDSEEVPG